MIEKNVPKLRFPGFDGEWEKTKLTDIFITVQSGVSVNSSDLPATSDKLGVLKTSCISKGKFYPDENKQIIDAEIYRAKLNPKKNSILISRMNTPQLVGESGLVEDDFENLFIPDRLWLATTSADYVPKLISIFLSSDNMMTKISNIATGTSGSMKNISKEYFLNLQATFPLLTEQRKMADFFRNVDDKLNHLKKKKSLLEQYKKGMMQKIFTQEIRFMDDDGKEFGEWEEKALGECLEYEQPTKYLVANTDYDNTYPTPVVTAGKTFILGYTDETNGIFNNGLPVIIFDDFTTATQFVDFPFKAKSSAMKILKAKENVNIKYMYEAMQQIEFEIGGHGRHWISVFAHLPVAIPTVKEQTKIANFLSAIDDKINLVAVQIEKCEVWKKGLLREMFV